MAKKNYQYNTDSVSGLHIYEDDKGRKIYYQPRTMRGYVIQDENVKAYQLYANRFMIPVLAGLIAYIAFGDNGFPIYLCVLIALGVFIVMQYRFHKVFLPALIQLQHYIPKTKPSMTAAMAEQEGWRLLCKAVLYPIFGVLVIILFYQRMGNGTMDLSAKNILIIVFGVLILVLSLAYGIFNLKAFLYRRSHREQFALPKETAKKSNQK